jgi:hypothetical protein
MAQQSVSPGQTLPPKIGPNRGRSLADVVLSRLGTGVGPSEAAMFNRIGYATWLEQQLNPPKGDDPATAARLANAVLHIKYGGGDPTKQQLWPAVDEMRPLKTLSQPIDQLWPVLDNHNFPGQERRRVLSEVISATLIRWTHSAYPLREVIAQFWHDHFNVDAWDQEPVALALPTYDRDVIRAPVSAILGSFSRRSQRRQPCFTICRIARREPVPPTRITRASCSSYTRSVRQRISMINMTDGARCRARSMADRTAISIRMSTKPHAR